MKKIQRRIKELTKLVNLHYYHLDNQKISDHQFVAIFNKLLELEKEYPEYTDRNSPTYRKGSDAIITFKKRKYKFPILSVKNGGIDEVYLLLDDCNELVGEKRIDGLQVTLIYEDGQLLNVVSKGNGIEGLDVSQNARTIIDIPFSIDLNGYVEVQGFIYCLMPEFYKYSKNGSKYKTPGHMVSNLMKLKSSDLVAPYDLKFMANCLMSDSIGAKSYLNVKDVLRNSGFKTLENYVCNSKQDIKNIIEKTNVGEIPVNGILFKAITSLPQKEVKLVKGYDKMAIVWHRPEHVQGKIIGVEWVTHKNGNIVPFAVFEKLVIHKGSKIWKISFKNAENFQKIKPCYNDMVEFEVNTTRPEFSNIVKNLRVENPIPINLPSTCSRCNSEIIRLKKHIRCLNYPECIQSESELSDSTKYKYREEIDLDGKWKYMHLKIVADFFGAKACRSIDSKTVKILMFNSCNQIADICYTLCVEKMPVKVIFKNKKIEHEINNKLISFGKRVSIYFFHADRYNTNLKEVQEIQGEAFPDIGELGDDILSFSYVDMVKYSLISLFFSLLGISKDEPLQIIINKPALYQKKKESTSFWRRMVNPVYQLSKALSCLF